MTTVYLSYAPEDAQRAEELRRILMARGHRPWRDPQPIEGANWHYEMDAAIGNADALVLLLTAAAGDFALCDLRVGAGFGRGAARLRHYLRGVARASALGHGPSLRPGAPSATRTSSGITS